MPGMVESFSGMTAARAGDGRERRRRSTGARPLGGARKKPAAGCPRRLFDPPHSQFWSVIRIYPGSVTLSSEIYRSGQILQMHRASLLKTAIFGTAL
ncbi:MAG: hypothetical protein QOJ27_2241 [Sphingomonadales bacterium]|nr:hypothetical protein [Sphingomonadales bacterium]